LNPLYEATKVLGFYCDNLVLMLEQAPEDYCNAEVKNEKELAIIDAKKYSAQLALLEPFYSPMGIKKRYPSFQNSVACLGRKASRIIRNKLFY